MSLYKLSTESEELLLEGGNGYDSGATNNLEENFGLSPKPLRPLSKQAWEPYAFKTLNLTGVLAHAFNPSRGNSRRVNMTLRSLWFTQRAPG